MTTLSVVGVENGSLVLVSADGDRFFVPITDQLTDALRPKPSSTSGAHTTSPKDIQAHIRRGLSAQEVADLTGEDLAYIQKFEGAVIAERDFMVAQAHDVVVHNANGESTFVVAVRTRLEEIGGREITWSAWREESGWRVELAFTEGAAEHRARWEFEQRKQLLTPLNDEASALSRHESVPSATLIPKLQAVTPVGEPDRFDSEIFEASDLGETGPMLEPVPYGRQGDSGDGHMADTADLLEALRKKRGERDGNPDAPHDRSQHPATGSIRIVEDDHDAEVTPITGPIRDDNDGPDDDDPTPPTGSRKDRAPMPSWDDIVFGARSDDDPA